MFSRIGKLAVTAAVAGGVVIAMPAMALAAMNTQQAAVQLEQSLSALPLNHIDYLYAYLQSVQFTPTEVAKIDSNAKAVQQLFRGDTNARQLTRAQKVQAVNLFLQSANLAHLKVSFVDRSGNPLNIIDYQFNGYVYVQLKDEKGSVLATLDPSRSDVAPNKMAQYVLDVKQAVQAAEVLGQSGKFVPIPHGKLPVTATNDPTWIVAGSLLILLGGLSLVPITMLLRRNHRLSAEV